MIIRSAWNLIQNPRSILNPSYNLTREPSEITLSNNMVSFGFTPAPLSNPSFASIRLRVVAPPTAGFSLQLSNSLGTLRIRASISPGAGEFLTNNSGTSLPNRILIAEAIAYELQRSSWGQLYTVTAIDADIQITALTTNSLLNIQSSIPSQLNLLVVNFTAASASDVPSSSIDSSLFAEVYSCTGLYGTNIVKTSGTFRNEIVIPYSSPNEINVSISDSLNYQLSIQKPVKQSSILLNPIDASGPKHLIPYYLAYGEYKRFELRKIKKKFLNGVSSIRWMQLGAFDLLNEYNLQEFVLNPNVTTFLRFMSDMGTKEVTYDAHEYVGFIYKQPAFLPADLNIVLDYRFDDGTTGTSSILVANFNNITGGNNIIDVSPNILNLPAIEAANNKLITEYSIYMTWAFSTTTGISSRKNYKVYRQCDIEPTNFVWLNKYGQYDSLEFKGNLSREILTESERYNTALPFNANTSASEATQKPLTKEFMKTVNVTYTVSTGLIKSDIYDSLHDLLNSPAIWVWDKEISQYKQVIITDNDFNTISPDEEKELTVSFIETKNTNTITL